MVCIAGRTTTSTKENGKEIFDMETAATFSAMVIITSVSMRMGSRKGSDSISGQTDRFTRVSSRTV